MNEKHIANEIRTIYQNRKVNRPLLVGLDGLGGSGKTTLANQLQVELAPVHHVTVLHLDDYIVRRNKRYHTGHPEWFEYYYLQWDVEMLKRQLFQKINHCSLSLTLPFYDKSTNRHMDETILFKPDSIILIEGIFLQREEWKSFLDVTIFLTCDKEIRYERVLKRDTYLGDAAKILDKYNRRYWAAENYYVDTVNPERLADRIYYVNGL